jgi:protein transport protein SEC61 subunit gamma-like protein
MAFSPTEFVQSMIDNLKNFVSQSERVINVTHKPRGEEFRRIAYITAIGMIIIGMTGFIISMAATYLTGGL